jgi:hypothetical protein
MGLVLADQLSAVGLEGVVRSRGRFSSGRGNCGGWRSRAGWDVSYFGWCRGGSRRRSGRGSRSGSTSTSSGSRSGSDGSGFDRWLTIAVVDRLGLGRGSSGGNGRGGSQSGSNCLGDGLSLHFNLSSAQALGDIGKLT